jgi:hypothetical protein
MLLGVGNCARFATESQGHRCISTTFGTCPPFPDLSQDVVTADFSEEELCRAGRAQAQNVAGSVDPCGAGVRDQVHNLEVGVTVALEERGVTDLAAAGVLLDEEWPDSAVLAIPNLPRKELRSVTRGVW